MRKRIANALLACLPAVCLQACHSPAAAAPSEPPPVILGGIGRAHHVISTQSPRAQAFFDQGLAQLYGFNFYEAGRSFRQAAALDPTAAMPWWGVAMVLGPNYNTLQVGAARESAAYDAVQQAKAREAKASSGERAYIDALASRFSDDPGSSQAKLAHDYATAMRLLSARYPDDPDAAALYAESLMELHAWHLWTPDGQPAPGTDVVLDVLRRTLKRWPDHLGANHYYVHALEGSPDPGQALPNALRLAALAPASGHLQHMVAHILIHTGDYGGAVEATHRAEIADDAYLRYARGANPSYAIGYAQHNLLFEVTAAEMAGDFAAASRAAAKLAAEADAADEGFRAAPLFALVRFARWKQILAMPAPPRSAPGLVYFWHYARACAFAELGRVADAEAERARMQSAFLQVPPG